MKLFTKILILFMFPALSFAQSTVNLYARVTAVSSNTLTISNATGSFTTGEAIVMQMQDSTIGSNTANNSSFGNLGGIQSAGLMEVVNITAATSTTITLSGNLTNTFNTASNGRVQLISYPTLGGGGNYTLSSAITGAAWNGNTGGVVAFKVNGTLTLNNNINIDAKGFRGGAASANAPSYVSCDPDTYYDNAGGISTTYYGHKGESIHNSTTYTVGKGKILNGGGGGNQINAGGGGGGNFTAGGIGGQGWSCSISTASGGLGGIDLSTYISSTRFFLGGGGGGGQQNDNVASAGGSGGGIIMIKATAVQTSTGCNSGAGSISISAKGQTTGNSGNDGAGGGGAGGTVLIETASYTINNACPVNMNTSGGNGGTVNNSGSHGGGAGGGKGVVIFSGIVGTPTNVNVIDTAGTGGGNSNAAGTTTAGSGNAISTSGTSPVMYVPTSVLPVHLISFAVTADKNNALLQWKTGIETGFAYYEIERSVDNAVSYQAIGKVQATGNNAAYTFINDLSMSNVNGVVYYRLKIVDKNGGFQYSDIRTLSFTHQNSTVIRAYPNPAGATVYVYMSSVTNTSKVNATIHDMQGRMVKYFSTVSFQQDKTIALSLEGVTAGQYIVTLNNAGVQEHTVITKQ